MPATSGTVLEVNQTGIANDLNGGGFDQSNAGSLGNDMTYGSTAAVVSGAASSSNTTTVSATWATASMQGNLLNVPGYGTGTIVAVSAGVGFTLNAAIGTFTSVTSYVGGPKASPGAAFGLLVQGNKLYWAQGTYNATSATANVSGGVISVPSVNNLLIQGYGTSRTDFSGKPTLVATLASQTLFTTSGTQMSAMDNMAMNGNSQAGSIGWNVAGYFVLSNCDNLNTTSKGFVASDVMTLVKCFGKGCSGQAPFYGGSATYRYCVAVNNSVNGFDGTPAVVERCISANNTGIGFNLGNQFEGFTSQCVAYGNTGDGIASSQCQYLNNSISANNGGTGFNSPSSYVPSGFLENNAAFSNTGGNYLAATSNNIQRNNITLTAGPFANPTMAINSWADAFAAFALNNTAGGGALCRGAGTPQYLDIGAVQHQDSGGGGGVPRIVVPRRIW